MSRNLLALGVAKVPEPGAPSTEAFYAVLRDSILDGMIKVLGAEGTRAILFHLDLPSFYNPKEFHERLTEIFGFGTASLERIIIQQLHRAMGVSPAFAKDDDFVCQVELARRRFDDAEGRRQGARV